MFQKSNFFSGIYAFLVESCFDSNLCFLPQGGSMKLVFGLFTCLIISVYSKSAHAVLSEADVVEPRAVQVDYFGGYTGYDRGGYQLLRAAVGQLVADGTLGYFTTEAVGKSGGGSFCLGLAPNTEKTTEDILRVLRSIRPADELTVYRFKLQTECTTKSFTLKETK